MSAAHSRKIYKCSRCGCQTIQSTNHSESTHSWGRVNVCPDCPPWAKYPEFGGGTTWVYVGMATPSEPPKI